MPITFIVNYEVKDFNIWKKAFASNSEVRKSAGIKATPYKEIENPNKVYIVGEAPSKELLEEMFSNPRFVQLMQTAGVITKPNVVFLNK